MLSEHHDIRDEFPEFQRLLDAKRAADAEFAAVVTRHDQLDDEIRQLEECQSPIGDAELEKLKLERIALKDRIYQALRADADEG